jgi:hypothetical protein
MTVNEDLEFESPESVIGDVSIIESATPALPPSAVAERLAPPQYVFALGRVEPRFPSLDVEKEFAQALGDGDNAGLTDREAFQAIVGEPANRYLARNLCWVFTIEGLETYILVPRDPGEVDLLVDAVRPRPDTGDVDIVVGVLGPLAFPDACGGLVIPIVAFDQLYSFDRDSLVDAIPRPKGQKDDAQFSATAAELLDRIMQVADNTGATDEHRALNYLAVRYPAIYARAAQAHSQNASLTEVSVRPSRLSGVRRIVDVVFAFTHRQTDVIDQYYARVDVTGLFPFLVTKLSPYYER